MKSIWKYELKMQDFQIISMPKGAEILCVQNQSDTACLWCKVDTEAEEKEGRAIMIHGTGHPIIDDGYKYIGSVQLADHFVFHIFEDVCS